MQPDSVPKQMCIRDRLISVPSQYALAIETALGGALQNLIVADEEIAKSCIRRLQREKAGRATFLPLTSVKGSLLDQPGLDKEPGFIGLASELIDTDPAYRGIARFLLGRIVIASDLDAASDMAKKNRYRFRVVTLDGQQVNVGGSFTGGSAARTQGLLSRRGEAAALRKDCLLYTSNVTTNGRLKRNKGAADEESNCSRRRSCRL